MPRTPFDNHAKDTTQRALRPYGRAETDVRITAETQYVDLRFVRGEGPRAGAYEDFLTRSLQPRSAALCTEEYRLNVERSPGVRVAFWTSLFFIVPAVLIGLALLLALGGLLFAARALR